MGESGIVGMGAAIASAVDDALGLPGAISELPIRPERVHALIATAANAAAVRGVESGA
jgi:carbon-monoxide dehydrogenase large subunit